MHYSYLSIIVFLLLTSFTIIDFDTRELRAISEKSLKTTVEKLCSTEFEGRLSGSAGYNKAAEYIADEFSKLGLKPVKGNSYLQQLYVEYNEIREPLTFSLLEEDGSSVKYNPGSDFVARGFSGSGSFTSEVVFCGYGISNPQSGYDDYTNIDVTNKVVMIFKYNPSWKLDDQELNGGGIRKKVNLAAEHGAKGVLFVSKPNDDNPQEPIGSILHGKGEHLEDLPQLHIDIPVADNILELTGYNLKKLQTLIDSNKEPFPVETDRIVKIEVNAKYYPNMPTYNVAGILPGTDSQLKKEHIIVGAHLDHVGKQGINILFPGANDNASGSASVLEIAKAFVKNNIEPERSIIFILFASEEQGLFGSKYFVENSPVPEDDIVAMLNLDCVGYGDSIKIGNGKSAPELWEMVKENDNQLARLMVDDTWKGGGADAGPFHDAGIPAVYFVTTNSYEHLHLPSDKPNTINYPLHKNITDLAYLTLRKLADGEYFRENVIF